MGQSILVNFPADDITIADSGNLFTAKTAEDALAELKTESPKSVLTTRGDILYRGATAPVRLAKGNVGDVLIIGGNDPSWIAPDDLAFTDTNDAYATPTVGAALNELAPTLSLLANGLNQYKILDTIPTVQSEMYEGLIVYEKTGKTLQICTTPGEQEIDTLIVNNGAIGVVGDITIVLGGEVNVPVELNGGAAATYNATITSGATASGDIIVHLQATDYPVTVAENDTAAQVAGRITAAFADKSLWIVVSNVDATVTFAYQEPGVRLGTFTVSGGDTGVACTGGIVEAVAGLAMDTTEETAGKIRDAVYTGWTTGGTGATVTFTRDAVGAVAAPTFTDTDNTHMTISGAFARTNEGVDSVWAALINA
ncbi:MAG: hypothetical protein PHX74_06540 [Candidatus Sumerlaeales bacterium]|nr:hypothetical protein [Candidatus Sumerlaeales bacterium]